MYNFSIRVQKGMYAYILTQNFGCNPLRTSITQKFYTQFLYVKCKTVHPGINETLVVYPPRKYQTCIVIIQWRIPPPRFSRYVFLKLYFAIPSIFTVVYYLLPVNQSVVTNWSIISRPNPLKYALIYVLSDNSAEQHFKYTYISWNRMYILCLFCIL